VLGSTTSFKNHACKHDLPMFVNFKHLCNYSAQLHQFSKKNLTRIGVILRLNHLQRE